MNLSELGLKTKPATKYFAGGYFKFRTYNKDLSYELMLFPTKSLLAAIGKDRVKSIEHIKDIMSAKTSKQAIEVYNRYV